MPHYYIDTDGPEGPCPDPEGITLDSVEAARALAMEGLGEMVRDASPGEIPLAFTVTIRIDAGVIGTMRMTVAADWRGVAGSPALDRALRAVDRATLNRPAT